MSTFDEGRRALREARQNKESAGEDALNARERLKRIETRQKELDRVFDPGNQEHVKTGQSLDAAHAAAVRNSDSANAVVQGLTLVEQDLFRNFAPFTDPTQAIGRLDDGIPLLLLPVRLETRFRGTSGVARELWVRVYPDDCSIDTFEPALSEMELKNTRLYWLGLWQAGKFVDQERGAWRELVGDHGSGRAEWLVVNYAPAGVDTHPMKAAAHDVILTIPTEAALTVPAEIDALAAFWIAVWRGDGDAETSPPRAALVTAIGDAARAAQLIENYVPSNLDFKPTPPLTKSDVAVSVAFVVFPPSASMEIRRHSWSRPARVTTLPDRFVFIGQNAGRNPVVIVGNPVPSPLIAGPDPAASETDRLRQDASGNLIIPDEMKWMTDFNRAVNVGMGFRVNLDTAGAPNGFDRVLVVGVRLGDDPAEGQAVLQTLLEHHRFSRGGFGIVPQGTPTNNTDSGTSGYTRAPDADESFDRIRRGVLFAETSDPLLKRDGQWLAEYLGLPATAFDRIAHADGRDQADARAMNTALWPATLGYWMETMMAPVFSDRAIGSTRDFFQQFVSGRGAIPAIRIGRQPYGILPATALSKMAWLARRRDPTGAPEFLPGLYRVLQLMDADWRAMSNNVSFAGKSGDPHRILLDIVGLHPVSVEVTQRWAETLEELYNRLNLEGFGGLLAALILGGLKETGIDLLDRLGYHDVENPPDILDKIFFGRHNTLMGPVIDDVPLSETSLIRAYTTDGRNYVRWLADAARTSLDALYRQQGFIGNRPPGALLYILLRHALQLGYHDASVRFHETTGLFGSEQIRSAKRDDPFIHVRQQQQLSESRYELLYKREARITGDSATRIGDFIGATLHIRPENVRLSEQVHALERLADASTARLERALMEHIDLCTYRLDAWLLGLVHLQLDEMRRLRTPTARRTGIYLGAYAWLEEVRPQNRVLTPQPLTDPDLAAAFGAGPPLMRDSSNQGFIHAPSLNHAVAAAVLRSGYVTNASPANQQTLAVNLTSERVRTALGIIEGIRGGQSLSALLGYQFERGLHDRHGLAEVDEFIFDLRREFPLVSNRQASTRDPNAAISEVEARNVLDGLQLVNHVKNPANRNYKFGIARLPDASDAQRAAIDAEVDRLLETHDAVADLALAEGVYQAVLGNYDRVGSTYDAYSKGNFPPEPQVLRTPTTGSGVTHRVALHLDPAAGGGTTPRAKAEPATRAWVASVFPAPSAIGCMVSYLDANTRMRVEEEVKLDALGLEAVDWIELIRDGQQETSELDERILRRVVTTRPVRPDERVQIAYMRKDTATFSVFEVMPLVRHLKQLLRTARPLRATDLAISNEASTAADQIVSLDMARLAGVRDELNDVKSELDLFITNVDGALAANLRDAIAAAFDTAGVSQIATIFASAARFNIPQTGWGFAYEVRERLFRSVLAKCAAMAERWGGRLIEFDALIVQYGLLPLTASDTEKYDLLAAAERLISTSLTSPPLPAPNDLRDDLVNVKRMAFEIRLLQLQNVANTHRTELSQLLADVKGQPPIAPFDFMELSFEDEEDQIIVFAEDAARVMKVVRTEVIRRLDESQAAFDAHDAAASAAARVASLAAAAKALLGDDFVVVPRFTLPAAQGDEVEKALDASTSGTLLDYVTNTLHVDFPVDTWLYGAARVRDNMRAWEQTTMLAEAFRSTAPPLTPLQLPFVLNDPWMALQFPPGTKLDFERVLYTVSLTVPFSKSAPQCGLLVDEWSEIIPQESVDTGVAVHFDRPNSEAPQSLLLVTPADFRSEWQWSDVVDALNETLDFAKRRAVEPVHIDATPYARFLPATIMAVTVSQLSISANLAINNLVIAQGNTP